MNANPDRILANVRQATTADLLERVTAFRRGMEPEALALIEVELHQRGISAAQIVAHAERQSVCVKDANGAARQCSRCFRPATVGRWRWHRLWGKLPLFPRFMYFCAEHA